ncbi:MAG: Ni/Fe-hydrogenase, b-type cytochrome subunit [bacterium]
MAYTKEHHPIPARLMHTIHILAIIALAVTGFFIYKPNFPLFGMGMATARTIHFWAMFIVLLNLLVRFYWAILGSNGDIKEFLPQKENKGTLFPLLAYYTFMRKSQPMTAKYNTLQKSTYSFWFFLLIFQGLTGFAMYWKGNALFAPVIGAAGGLLNLHVIHYLTMWVFIATTMVHVYLVLFEDFKSFKLMILGIESEGAHHHHHH